ncbi:hypothetical protein BO79DRAFT_232418 [Aspergillus costaricaensis CBS 115574]|uniref:Uncharacterized protein n=1 Tax=Aspergillus costaricaensis CBS 115574 TaxID=1448317 RepID=A0ACD1I1F3_9EURO|nr:hypothetical protein BO79DRAFT_232418 [Aspergillus costaricaensis CBS 115574]RAK84324.1 hypothetical protein BO79DRAFT_232418 [Aspergillus costaricaensis CBS 115574]
MRNKQSASRTGDHISVSGDNDMHIVPCIVDQWMLLDSLLVDHFALLLSNIRILTACMLCTLKMAPSLVVWVSG